MLQTTLNDKLLYIVRDLLIRVEKLEKKIKKITPKGVGGKHER